MDILIWVLLGLVAAVGYHCFFAFVCNRPLDEFIPSQTLLVGVICGAMGPLSLIVFGAIVIGTTASLILNSDTMNKRYRLRGKK